MKLLLQQKDVVVDSTTKQGRTALMYAAAAGNRDVVEALMAKDASLDMKDTSGWSLLDFASAGGHDFLLSKLKIDIKNEL